MERRVTIRSGRAAQLLLGVGLLASPCLPVSRAAAPGLPQQAPAPIERRPPSNPAATAGNAMRRGARGEHLAQWMNQHSNLSPQQQQQALEREPGFRDLPTPTQQRMRDRLAQLDAMKPQRRQRLLARNEALERLTPEQRADVGSALQQLGNLPQDQRRAVAHTFRQLRDLPPEQRIAAFSTGRYGPPLADNQRAVLFNLLRVEPMLPPPAQASAPIQAVPPAQAFH